MWHVGVHKPLQNRDEGREGEGTREVKEIQNNDMTDQGTVTSWGMLVCHDQAHGKCHIVLPFRFWRVRTVFLGLWGTLSAPSWFRNRWK